MLFSDFRLWLAAAGVGLVLAGPLILAGGWYFGRALVRALIRAATAELQRQQEEADRKADAEKWRAQQAEKEAAEKQARLDELTPLLMSPEGAWRQKEHWNTVDATERLTSIALEAVEDAQVIYARQQNLLLAMEWIRHGGNPKAPWKEIVMWKNKREAK